MSERISEAEQAVMEVLWRDSPLGAADVAGRVEVGVVRVELERQHGVVRGEEGQGRVLDLRPGLAVLRGLGHEPVVHVHRGAAAPRAPGDTVARLVIAHDGADSPAIIALSGLARRIRLRSLSTG